jgi:hypothetical protein
VIQPCFEKESVMFHSEMKELSLSASRNTSVPRPSYQPAVERLEERIVLNASFHTLGVGAVRAIVGTVGPIDCSQCYGRLGHNGESPVTVQHRAQEILNEQFELEQALSREEILGGPGVNHGPGIHSDLVYLTYKDPRAVKTILARESELGREMDELVKSHPHAPHLEALATQFHNHDHQSFDAARLWVDQGGVGPIPLLLNQVAIRRG